MLTFSLPHFLPLLYLIIDCRLHTHTHSRFRFHSLLISLLLLLLTSSSLAILSLHTERSVILLSFLRSNGICLNLSRYIYSGINGSDIADDKLFVSLQMTNHFIAKWRNSVEHCTLACNNYCTFKIHHIEF